MFQTYRIQTNPADGTTEIIIRVTNTCKDPKTAGVYYAQFSLDSANGQYAMALQSPVAGATWQGSGAYAWTVSVVDGRLAATKTSPAIKWIRFTPQTPAAPNTQMLSGSTGNNFEMFRFVVKNYDPVFPWYFQLHQGSDWDTFGPLDMSLCACVNCDASASVRQISACSLRYPDSSSNLSPSTFNEDEVLYSFQIEGNQLELFYSDEHAMTLGTNYVINGATNTSFAVTPTTANPTCVSGASLQMGAWNFDGHDPMANIDGNSATTLCVETVGKPTCGRPLPPALFVTDVTTDANNRSGDWQQGGPAFPPQKVCGLWKSVNKKILTHATTTDTYTFDINAPGNPTANRNAALTGWNLGVGSDPLPIGFINPANNKPVINTYGTEVMWNLDLLQLNPSHKYRFQFTVHDGDQTRAGGDVGEGCIIASSACVAGFSGASCLTCEGDNAVLTPASYTWFCFPTGNTGSDYYHLIKVPISKIRTDPSYNASGGFIPKTGVKDAQGFPVTCDCKRQILPCPNNCCGNGVCNGQNATCTCNNGGAGADPGTCCLSGPVTGDCNNDGNYCSGHGTCVNGNCLCFNGADGTPDFTGVACNISVVKLPKCANLTGVSDCKTCLNAAEQVGIFCGWCTSGTPNTQAALDTGSCQETANCAAPATPLASCLLTVQYVPEPCPDNCTGHGKCVNRTVAPVTGSTSNSTNYTLVCVCTNGYKGVNCGTAPPNAITVGLLTAGAIAGIIVGVAVFLCLGGGGAYAAATFMGSGSVGPVVNNPLYQGEGNKGTNPLYKL